MKKSSHIIYKLTDKKLQTHGNFQWEIGKWQKPLSGEGGLCSPGFYHAYTHPLLAVLLNPIHANINDPVLFIGRGRGTFANDKGCKVGYSEMMISKRIALPTVTTIQRLAFAILCAKEVYKNKDWNTWADKWLSGEDRSKASTNAARAAAGAAARAADAAYVAGTAARAAARATDAAYVAGAAARAAGVADAAGAAADVADVKSFNLIELAKKALKYK